VQFLHVSSCVAFPSPHAESLAWLSCIICSGELLEDDFVAFHLAAASKSKGGRKSLARTKSVVLKGTGEQAALAYGFSKFERMITTLLATLLERGSIIALLGQIEQKVSKNASSDCDLGVINVDDLKEILNSMGKSDW